jgi:peptide/nickel transport system substrate-binding protein
LEEENVRFRFGAAVALAAVLAATVAACGGGGQGSTASSESEEATTATAAPTGGIYRIGVESSFNFTDGFDPTGEYLTDAMSLQTNLLVRTLVGYRHTAGAAGNELVPDLAVALPQVSSDGLTWTFRLKDGIRFGPPLHREITSRDVAYAFERIGTPSLGAQYGGYYDVIEGMDAFRAGKAKTISGIETPDPKTVVFHLTHPTGDFGYRLAMPAAGPIPEEVAGCFDEPGEYGRYLVSSGPYMIAGSDDQDATSCATLRPLAGFDPNASLSLVRNPDYDPKTDSPEAREAKPDGFLLTIDSNSADIFAKIQRGELEGEWAAVPPKVLKQYSESDSLRDRLHVESADTIAYLTMNLTQPPFDDIHVRKAVNLVMDKEGLQRAWGGPLKGSIATHVLPDSLVHGKLDDYDPYPANEIAAAKVEMAKSRYDTDGDGMCDAPVCDGVLNISTHVSTPRAMEPVVEDSLAKIGIHLDTREVADPFAAIQTPRKNVPFSLVPSWSKDYADPSTFAPLFSSRSIIPTGNVNYSLVGLTQAIASKVGADGDIQSIPSVDADIAKCVALLGDERTTCWANLDRKLMEDVVPWVPYLDRTNVDVVGPAVAEYRYDQATGTTAYAHVAVDASAQKGT